MSEAADVWVAVVALAGAEGDFGRVLLIAALVVLGIIAIGYSILAAKRRREAMRRFAEEMGFRFVPYPGEHHAAYSHFEPFGNGHSRSSTNLVEGKRGNIAWEMFDFKYVTGSGKHRTTHQRGIVLARLAIALPTMRIRPEGLFDKLAAAIGFDDIDFESEEFSKRYHVRSSNRKAAFDVIHPGMIEYLLDAPQEDWQVGGPVVLLFRNRRLDPREIPPIMALIEGFVGQIPRYLWQDLGTGGVRGEREH